MTQTLEPKSKRVYKPRRDWRKEMETLVAHCHTAIELIAQWNDKLAPEAEAFWNGQTAALKNVLARIERKP